ncbi:unnamed protein product [Caenorhabditis auriculariae]|uniref:3-dehydrosphinganine reductase n=1 Tax=Caenorhabditis auriculariae TaxID=2777116 RepID=A0A8S1HL31_9PELO|nr:unnamed protein product [Caenorhabditis auriculariae]
MGKEPIEADFARLGLKIETADDAPFTAKHFELFVNDAVKNVLGSCGPVVKISHFDENRKIGSVIAVGNEVLSVWAAISVSGTFLNRHSQIVMLVYLVLIPVLLFAFLLAFFLVIYFSMPSSRDFHFFKKHALVTGGSKGIGYQLAAGLIERGANVTIVARNVDDLKKSCASLQELADGRGQRQKVQWKSLDLTKNYDEIKKTIEEAEKEFGPVDVLINNAGHSVQAPFEKIDIDDFEKQMRVNYLSAVFATRAVIEGMKQRKSGHISFVSSAAGQFAIYGYTAYSATKFALRGLADALHMELLPFKVNVGILYPPNTDTEGFKYEIQTMPEEVRLISETAGLFTPEFVAEAHLKDVENGQYATTIGLDGWMLGNLTAGASPEKSLWRAFVQTWLAGLFRGITLVYMGYFNGIVKKCHRRRLQEAAEAEETSKSE